MRLDFLKGGLDLPGQDFALRFFDGKSMKEIGAALGASEAVCESRIRQQASGVHCFQPSLAANLPNFSWRQCS